jgi:hypothetical protein
MKVTILDTKTGEEKCCHDWPEPGFEVDVWWWSGGNGGCDCNRALAYDAEVDEDEASGRCVGSQRFLISKVGGNLEGMTEADVLREVNADYPPELLERFGLPVLAS